MARDLPGFYFDEAKNRYFPLSSKPKPPLFAASTSRVVDSSKKPPRKRNRRREDETSPNSATISNSESTVPRGLSGAWHASEASKSAPTGKCRRRKVDDFLASQVALTSACQSVSLSGWNGGPTISALGVAAVDGRVRAQAGTYDGGTYCWDIPEASYVHLDARTMHNSWIVDTNLRSRISSVCHSYSHWVATSFGPHPYFYIQAMDFRSSVVLNLNDKMLRDVWTSDLRGFSLAIGLHRGVWLIHDISRPLESLTKYPVESDVFALHQDENLIYAGMRNGAVLRIDTRAPAHPSSSQTSLLDGAFVANSNSVVYLNRVHEHELLVSTIRGTMEIFDLRYALANRPVMALQGHVNAYRSDLPHALTPSHDFLFAAGLDTRIRAWSLLTGVLLNPSTPPIPTSMPIPPLPADHDLNPFTTTFPEPVSALSVAHLDTSNETFLFAATGRDVHRFTLGGRYFEKTGTEGWWDHGG